tara:strand:+ start:2886 stop:3263 length:378 start_codon:yes stop_codon:yes gene_type:complete
MRKRYQNIRKAFITLVPIITLFLVTISTVVYNLFTDEYYLIYDVINNTFGYGIFWLPIYYYGYEKYHLCFYTKVALDGLTTYSVINLIYFFTDLNTNLYFTSFEVATLVVFSLITIYFILKNTLK